MKKIVFFILIMVVITISVDAFAVLNDYPNFHAGTNDTLVYIQPQSTLEITNLTANIGFMIHVNKNEPSSFLLERKSYLKSGAIEDISVTIVAGSYSSNGLTASLISKYTIKNNGQYPLLVAFSTDEMNRFTYSGTTTTQELLPEFSISSPIENAIIAKGSPVNLSLVGKRLTGTIAVTIWKIVDEGDITKVAYIPDFHVVNAGDWSYQYTFDVDLLEGNYRIVASYFPDDDVKYDSITVDRVFKVQQNDVSGHVEIGGLSFDNANFNKIVHILTPVNAQTYSSTPQLHITADSSYFKSDVYGKYLEAPYGEGWGVQGFRVWQNHKELTNWIWGPTGSMEYNTNLIPGYLNYGENIVLVTDMFGSDTPTSFDNVLWNGKYYHVYAANVFYERNYIDEDGTILTPGSINVSPVAIDTAGKPGVGATPVDWITYLVKSVENFFIFIGSIPTKILAFNQLMGAFLFGMPTELVTVLELGVIARIILRIFGR